MNTSAALKFVTVGAILCFIMPYVTLLSLAILLWLDAKEIGLLSLEKVKSSITEWFLSKTTLQWLTNHWPLNKEPPVTKESSELLERPVSFFQPVVPLFHINKAELQ